MSTRSLGVSSEELQAAWQQVKVMTALPNPPDPKLLPSSAKMPMKTRLHGIQSVISALEYNYTGTLYFDVNKNRSFKSVVSTAKDMLKEVLPIQCLEAVFLGAYLTAGLPEIDRFPVSFKSMTGDTVHRHIVLAVRHQHALQTKWGSLGLSRVDGLMYKELKFPSLSALIQDYCNEFARVYHSVVKVYVGFPFSHDIHSSEKVEWRMLNVPLDDDNWPEVAQHLDGFAKEAAEVLDFKKAKGELPDWFATKFPLHTPEGEAGKYSPHNRRHTVDCAFDFALSLDNPSPPAPAKLEESPEKPSGPILVAPDQVVFKQALSDTAQVLPTNVFLQNTTTSAFLVEIEEPSGQIEVVTKPPPTSSGQGDQTSGNNNDGGSTSSRSAVTTFRISAKGMIVVAMRFTSVGIDSTAQQAAQSSTENQGTGKAKDAHPKTASGRVALGLPSAGSRGKKAKATPAESSGKEIPPAVQAVVIRCTRLTRSSDGSGSEVPDGEAFVHELPFTVKSC